MRGSINVMQWTLVAGIVGLSIGLTGQTLGKPERFMASAVNLDRGGISPLEIVIDRWSTNAEHKRLLGVLLSKGPDKLLDALQSNPSVGYVRNANGGLRWELRYARHTPRPDGGEVVMAATDRPISIREQVRGGRTLDYPFTTIELTIDGDGKGQGKMSAAAKISVEKRSNTVVVENWGLQPIALQGVTRQPPEH